MLNKLLAVSVFASGLVMSAPASASNFTLDFSGDICQTGTGICLDRAFISQDYGDRPDVNFTYRTRSFFGNTVASQTDNVEYWKNNYSELVDVIYADYNGGVAEIQVDPLGGSMIDLVSLDIGSYFAPGPSLLGPTRTARVSIFDSNWNELWTTGNRTFGGLSETLMPAILPQSETFYLQLGEDWNVGMDNITFSTNMNPIPLPPSAALMLSAIVGGAFFARRKRAAS